jgi:glycosyltransferase involved in cell wall biosynthesis
MEIEKLLNDPARQLELGRQARRDVESYTWLARAEKVLKDFV